MITVVKQEDEADCGACCLLSIIKYYNGNIPLELVKVDTLTTKDGTNFYNLKEAAEKYGFEVIGKKEDLFKYTSPVIAQINQNNLLHFVVIYDVSESFVWIMDPAIGKRKINKSDFNNVFTGYILKLTPIKNIVNYKPKSMFLNLLKNTLKENRILFIKILILTIFICSILLLNTIILNDSISEKDTKLIILIFILLLSKSLITYFKNTLIYKANNNIGSILCSDYIKQVLYLPFKYLQLRKEGDLISRFEDINTIKENVTITIIEGIINLILIICTSSILVIIDKEIFKKIIIITLIITIIVYFYNKKLYQTLEITIDSNTNLVDTLISILSNSWTIKIINKTEYYLKKIKGIITDNNKLNYKLNKKIAFNDLLISSYNESALIIIIIYSIILSKETSDILTFIFINNYFISSVSYFLTIMPNILFFRSAYRRINSIYYLEREKNRSFNFRNGSIKISALTYKIGLNKIFDNFSYEINEGEKILIKGENGSGKSTLLNILFQAVTDYNGRVTINKTDLKDINLDSLRSKISYVNQSQKILPGTIKENIVLDNIIEEERFKTIERLLNLDKIYKTKYNGINSLIKDNFSGGEIQKIILARALYKDFDILLLDEALSEIEPAERKRIIHRICKYYKDKTIIIVSHNKEYYKFDKILFLTTRKEKGLC